MIDLYARQRLRLHSRQKRYGGPKLEIERKYLIHNLPEHILRKVTSSCNPSENTETSDPAASYPCRLITQGYLNTDPVIRIRQDNDLYELTYKSKGYMARQEYNLPLTKEAYEHLLSKIDGRLIQKKRYMIPLDCGLTAELDIFEGDLAPLILAEVEFPTEEAALAFVPPLWFGEDVTFSGEYHNSNLSKL